MNINDKEVIAAISGINRLNEIHGEFINELNKTVSEIPPLGTLTVNGDDLCVSCLGLEFMGHRRPIVVNSLLVANEYAFFGEIDGSSKFLISLYLTGDGVLFLTPEMKNEDRVCDFNNSYVREKILNIIISHALQSSFFEPRKP